MRAFLLAISPALVAAFSVARADLGFCADTVHNCRDDQGLNHPENWPPHKIQCCAPRNPDECMKARPRADHTHTPKVNAYYCEVFNYLYVGDYTKFDNSECAKGEKCLLSKGRTVTISDTWSVNGGLDLTIPGLGSDDGVAAFNLGASYSHTVANSYTTTITHSTDGMPYAKGKAGFWAHLPYYITSCGSMSALQSKGNCHDTPFCTSDYEWSDWYGTQPGNRFCNDSPLHGDGDVDGAIMFVTVDEHTREILPDDQQNPIWAERKVRPAHA